jgi:uncharacterized protein YyaL (SSP411 family)
MDASEPSTNGISASNLYRLSSLLNDEAYSKKAKETIAGFESEMLQYPWLFASFMPSIVAGHLGVKGIVVSRAEGKDGNEVAKIKEFETQPRGGLGTFARLDRSTSWLRGRNSLLKDFGLDGKARVLVCENGACREEGLGSEFWLPKESLDLSRVASALASTSAAREDVVPETEKSDNVVGQTPVWPGKDSKPF